MAKHEFGIIDYFEENKWYSVYEPEKYNCISVSDDCLC
jgi:ribosomal protein S3AE